MEAWRAAVHGVTNSQTRLGQLTTKGWEAGMGFGLAPLDLVV